MTGLLVACLPARERKPLFGGDPEPSLEPGRTELPPPPNPHAQSSAQALVAALRSRPSAERAAAARELLRRGEVAREDVEAALEEELLLVDILDDLARDLAGGAESRPPPRSTDATWVDDKYRLALDRYVSGDMYGALRLVDAILALEPDTSLRDKLRRLRNRARDRLVRDSVLAADVILPAADTLLPSERLEASIKLRNLSEEQIVLRLGDQRSLGVVLLDYEELSPDGTRTRTGTQHPIPCPDGEVVLRPGQSRTLPLDLPSPHRGLARGLVGRYHLNGRIRTHTILVGETNYAIFVPLFPEDLVVLRPEDAGLRGDPGQAFAEAVVEASSGSTARRAEPARRAFVSAILLAHEDREATVETLATALQDASGPLSVVLCAALARVTGEPLSFTRDEWLSWWAGRQARPERSAPDEDG